MMNNEEIRILFIDNDTRVVETMQRQLKESGYSVWVGFNGQDAVDLFRNFSPHICFIDLIMPTRDGESALLEIRQIDPESIVVIMSGVLTSDKVMFNLQLLSLKEKGARGFIMKPINLEKLEEKIETLVKARHG